MKSLLLTVAAFFSALVTGWFTAIIIASGFCDGYQPNWLCSGHGGAVVGFAILAIFISFPIYIYLFIYKNKKDKDKNDIF